MRDLRQLESLPAIPPLAAHATLRGRGLTVPEIATVLGVSRRTAFRYLALEPMP